jgi:DNA-binding GntR family transcriptional regulator
MTLDRASPVPLYYQLANQIESAIDRGDLGTGYRLDNEIELADRLGVSRPTMRRAIQELVAKGLLVRKRGVGTLVVHNQLKRRVELSSLYDDLLLSDHRPATRVVGHDLCPADDDVALALGIPVGEEVLELRRLRTSDGEPLAILHNWLPVDIAPFSRDDLEATGLYVLLRAAGVHLRVARQRIGARAATAAEAKLLGTRKGAPLVTMERTSYSDSGRAVELGQHVYRPENYTFEVTLVSK